MQLNPSPAPLNVLQPCYLSDHHFLRIFSVIISHRQLENIGLRSRILLLQTLSCRTQFDKRSDESKQ